MCCKPRMCRQDGQLVQMASLFLKTRICVYLKSLLRNKWSPSHFVKIFSAMRSEQMPGRYPNEMGKRVHVFTLKHGKQRFQSYVAIVSQKRRACLPQLQVYCNRVARMGPKKKTAKSDGGVGGGGKTNAPQAYKISRQLDQERIDFLAKRVEDLLGSNNDLRSSSSRNEKDTHDIVLYFQREMEMKDDIITRLNEELVKRETQLKFEVEKMKKKFDEEKAALVQSTDYTIVDLTQRLGKAEADLNALVLYQQDKEKYEARTQQLEKALKDQRQEMFDSMDEQERKFLEENATKMRELDEQKAAFREVRACSLLACLLACFPFPPCVQPINLHPYPHTHTHTGGAQRGTRCNGRGGQAHRGGEHTHVRGAQVPPHHDRRAAGGQGGTGEGASGTQERAHYCGRQRAGIRTSGLL